VSGETQDLFVYVNFVKSLQNDVAINKEKL
jgi:hypothetical protein